MNSPVVRTMMIADLEAVNAIEQAAHRAPWSENIIHYCLIGGYDCRVLVLKANDLEKIIGFYISRPEEGDCHLLNICLLPAYQGQHLGTYFMRAYLQHIKAQGVSEALLEVRPSNLVALHLYNKIGFVKIGIKEQYYQDSQGCEDAWVLSLNLETWPKQTA